MSKPIQEPSIPRQLANQEWGVLQLQRRPAPTGFVIPTFRAAQDTIDTVVPDNNEQSVSFDQWENNDTDVFLETTSAGNLTFVSLLQIGIYLITFRLAWEQGAGAVGTPDLSTIIYSDTYFSADAATHGNTFEAAQPAYVFSIMRSYPVFLNADRTDPQVPPAAIVGWQVNQSSPGAINQTTNRFGETGFEICYLGRGDFTPTYPP